MSWIEGRFFDGRTAVARAVQVWLGADRRVRVQGLDRTYEHPVEAVEFSARIGNTPRVIRFPDGASCEVADNDKVDAALEYLGVSGEQQRVHWLESRWKYALLAAAFAAFFVWASIQYGIPAMAKHVASLTPASVDRSLGIESIRLLDETMFDPSELPPEKRDRLSKHFQSMTRSLEDGHDYRLEFRKAPAIGANAFALPSGIVVITDELVALAGADEEIVAVLAHEIGHVVGRHSLRMLLQDSAVSMLIIALTGDVTTTSALIASVPTVLLSARHSRAFETEADDFAYAWMDRNGVPRRHFGAILSRLEKETGEEEPGWLSSHPRTADRLRE